VCELVQASRKGDIAWRWTMKGTSSATATSQDAGWFVDYDACVTLGKHRVVYGFSWLLRGIDHEAVLMDPKLFSSWVRRSVVCVVETGVWTADTSSRWRFSQRNDWIVQVIPQQAIKAIPVLSTRKIVSRRQKLGCHFFTFYYGVRSLRRCVLER
jgi:hypothetical protein